jgi:hypothetical protein
MRSGVKSRLSACLAILGAMILLAGCSSKAPPHGAPATKPKAATLKPMPANGLCAFIKGETVANLISPSPGAIYLSAPLPAGSAAGAICELANTQPMGAGGPFNSIRVSLSLNMQHGRNVFSTLQAKKSLAPDNVNGMQMLWNPNGTLYVQFRDANPAFTADPKGADSILTISVDSPNTSADIESSLATFAGHATDEISSGHVWSPESEMPGNCGNCREWGSGPMLIDDKGHVVPGPSDILQVYYALVEGNIETLGDGELGYGALLSTYWDADQMPYLSQAKVRLAIAKSMTAHPDCSDGCTYPEFAETGWSNATARADGIKLGVDPAKVKDPQLGHGLPVYTSNFPTSMDGWNGTFAPGN